MKIKIQTLFLWLLVFVSSVFFTPQTFAQTDKVIKTSYTDIYTLNYGTDVLVSKSIELTNKTALLYVSEFELSFSNERLLSDLQIKEDSNPANFTLTKLPNQTKVRIKFNQPSVGKDSIKHLSINYVLKNYLNQAGIHYELFVPVGQISSDEELINYSIKVQTPDDYPAVGISKPTVTKVSNHLYQWDNVNEINSKALYLSFSDKAFYQVDLNYLLANKSPYLRQMEIALVPDGIFQKAYLQDIDPKPQQVYTDEDGNLMATFKVPAQTIQKILYKGYVELQTLPRSEVAKYWQTLLDKDFISRYLTMENYWQISAETLQDPQISVLNNGLQIYEYVVDKLDYSINRVNQSLERKGAQWAYSNPDKAVCMEYTDLFVAISREKGIPAREVIGYGRTLDESILPLSFLGDVLHAWPEIYDSSRQIWRPIDPTWGDTSGINYYNSFDLSHISFVYHGKSANKPLPPGVYKLDPQSKDVLVSPTHLVPTENKEVKIEIKNKPIFIVSRSSNVEVKLSHLGNVILYAPNMQIKDKKTKTVLASKNLNLLEPLSSRDLKLKIKKTKLTKTTNSTLEILFNGKVVTEKKYRIVSLPTYFVENYGLIVILGFALILIFYLVKWRF